MCPQRVESAFDINGVLGGPQLLQDADFLLHHVVAVLLGQRDAFGQRFCLALSGDEIHADPSPREAVKRRDHLRHQERCDVAGPGRDEHLDRLDRPTITDAVIQPSQHGGPTGTRRYENPARSAASTTRSINSSDGGICMAGSPRHVVSPAEGRNQPNSSGRAETSNGCIS